MLRALLADIVSETPLIWSLGPFKLRDLYEQAGSSPYHSKVWELPSTFFEKTLPLDKDKLLATSLKSGVCMGEKLEERQIISKFLRVARDTIHQTPKRQHGRV